MKKYRGISLLLFVFVFAACQQQLLLDDALKMQRTLLNGSDEGTNLSFLNLAKQSSLKENGLPELTFKTNENGKAILIVKDFTLSGADIPNLGKISLTDKSKSLHFISDSFSPGHTVRLRLPNLPDGGTILQVEIQYFNAEGKPVKSYNYDVYVLEDGTSALQRPAFKGRGPIQLTGRSNYAAAGMVIVENDPAGIITAVQVRFNEPFGGPTPSTKTYVADCGTCQRRDTFQDRTYIFDVQFAPDQNPLGSSYSITAAMLNAKGETVGESFTGDVIVAGNKSVKGISKVAIKETAPGSGKFLIGALVENVNENRLDYVEVKFIEPINGPKPNQILFRCRKRPDMLTAEWDALVDFSLSDLQNNPLFVSNDAEVNPLFFEKSAVGSTYTIVTTVYNANGKPIGEPQSFEVKVEGTVASDEPVVLSSTLTSKDKGLTWDITVTIDDKGKWVEKVIYEFAKPYAGPAPLLNPITLVRTGEASGTIEVYSASGIKFEKSPEGFTYGGLIYQFGSGTRTSAGQASSKAELL
jgi:hypothetical protein